jgi:hypothetical protein
MINEVHTDRGSIHTRAFRMHPHQKQPWKAGLIGEIFLRTLSDFDLSKRSLAKGTELWGSDTTDTVN